MPGLFCHRVDTQSSWSRRPEVSCKASLCAFEASLNLRELHARAKCRISRPAGPTAHVAFFVLEPTGVFEQVVACLLSACPLYADVTQVRRTERHLDLPEFQGVQIVQPVYYAIALPFFDNRQLFESWSS